MTFQEAAFNILKKNGQPLDPIKIADIAFGEGMVKSKAKNPTRSFVETIKKNIRGNTYNLPELMTVKAPRGEFIILPEWL